MGFMDGVKEFFTGKVPPEDGVAPTSLDRVRAGLLAVNRADKPFLVREATPEENVDLIAEWNLADEHWRALLANGGITKTYQILMRLDAGRSEVRSMDKEWSVAWSNGIPSFSRSRFQAKGQIDETVHAFQYGFDEHGHWDKLYDYSFRTRDLKEPLQHATTGSGWTWHGAVLKGA
jgi:hypothetical protein